MSPAASRRFSAVGCDAPAPTSSAFPRITKMCGASGCAPVSHGSSTTGGYAACPACLCSIRRRMVRCTTSRRGAAELKRLPRISTP
eukprot:5299122-Prymnesium_polylepis.1